MRNRFLLALWLLTDLALFVAAYILAYFLRIGFFISTDFPLDRYVQTVVIITPLWLFVLGGLGVFRLTRVQSERRNLLHILFSCVMGSALFTLTYYFLHDRFFSRLLLVEAGGLSLLFTVVWHLAFDQWRRTVLRKNPPAFPILIVGLNREAERVIRLLEEKKSPLKPVAILDAQGSSIEEVAGVPVLGKLNKLEDVIRELHPTHLLQCSDLEHSINLMSVCRQHGLTYMLLPSVLGVVGGREEIITLEGQPLVTAKG